MSVKLGKKIMIVGSSGSGKSTLVRQLGEMLHLPVIHIIDFIVTYPARKRLYSAQKCTHSYHLHTHFPPVHGFMGESCTDAPFLQGA